MFDALIELVDPGVKPFKPVKGKSNVLMFVGLQVFFRIIISYKILILKYYREVVRQPQ